MQENKNYTALIILNYNNFEDTINCIESVQKYNSSNIKLIVIDNGSTRQKVIETLDTYFQNKFASKYKKIDEEKQGIAKLSYLTFLVSKINDGYAKGNNKGLKLAYADDEIDKILILNNDILFVEDILPKLLEVYNSDSTMGIISPILYKKNFVGIDYNCARKCEGVWKKIGRFLLYYINPFGIKDKWNMQQKYLLNKPELLDSERFEIALPSGSCMLCSKQLFKQIGSFDPNTFLYNEEDILYQKLHAIGKINWMLPKLRCIHLGASTTKHEIGYKMIKASADSTCYYIENYTDASRCIKFLFHLYIDMIFLPLVKLQKKFK